MYREVKAAVKGALLDPRLVLGITRDGLRLRKTVPSHRVQTLVGTHHKVLTVYMAQVFKAFAVVSGRSFCNATSPNILYDKEVICDHHSTFEFNKLVSPFRGIHVCRDPRDLLVSCAHYHLKSSERWLHEVGRWGLHGSTYQGELRALNTMGERLLFELNHEGGKIVEDMFSWNYSRPEFVELRYEEMVAKGATKYVCDSLQKSGLFLTEECALLEKLFVIFSTQGVLAQRRHIRDARPLQWKQHFTPEVEQEFRKRFGSAMVKLGYA